MESVIVEFGVLDGNERVLDMSSAYNSRETVVENGCRDVGHRCPTNDGQALCRGTLDFVE